MVLAELCSLAVRRTAAVEGWRLGPVKQPQRLDEDDSSDQCIHYFCTESIYMQPDRPTCKTELKKQVFPRLLRPTTPVIPLLSVSCGSWIGTSAAELTALPAFFPVSVTGVETLSLPLARLRDTDFAAFFFDLAIFVYANIDCLQIQGAPRPAKQ